MVHLANFSGSDVCKILEKHFGFFFVSQRGSHVKLRKNNSGRIVTTIVPQHSELSPGTLRGVLNKAEVGIEEFLKAIS